MPRSVARFLDATDYLSDALLQLNSFSLIG